MCNTCTGIRHSSRNSTWGDGSVPVHDLLKLCLAQRCPGRIHFPATITYGNNIHFTTTHMNVNGFWPHQLLCRLCLFLPASGAIVPLIWGWTSIWVIWSWRSSAVIRGHSVVTRWWKECRVDMWSWWWSAWRWTSHVWRWCQSHWGSNWTWRTRREGSWWWWALLRRWVTRWGTITWRRWAWREWSYWWLTKLTREDNWRRRPVPTARWTG